MLKDNVIPDNIIDAKEVQSPLPLLRLKKEMATMKHEEVVRIDCTDPGCQDDFENWCSRLFHYFLGAKKKENHTSYFIRKGND